MHAIYFDKTIFSIVSVPCIKSTESAMMNTFLDQVSKIHGYQYHRLSYKSMQKLIIPDNITTFKHFVP